MPRMAARTRLGHALGRHPGRCGSNPPRCSPHAISRSDSAPRVRQAREASTSPVSLLTDIPAILTVLHNGAHSGLASLACPTASRPASWHRSRARLLVGFYCCLEDERWRLTRSPRVPSITLCACPRELRASLHSSTPRATSCSILLPEARWKSLYSALSAATTRSRSNILPSSALFEIFGRMVRI